MGFGCWADADAAVEPEWAVHMRRSAYDIHLSPFVGSDLNQQLTKPSRNYTEGIRHVSVGIKLIFFKKKLFKLLEGNNSSYDDE